MMSADRVGAEDEFRHIGIRHNCYVCVSGNIGVGKTTATELLVQELGFRCLQETWETNPYLEAFYSDLRPESKDHHNAWAYRVQRHFLFSRTTDHDRINMMNVPAVQDRSIYEDMLFAQNQYELGLWTPEEFGKYQAFASLIIPELRSPDLLVYLKASVEVLRQRIERRGRAMEVGLVSEKDPYLPNLQRIYDDWFEGYRLGPKILVDAAETNFAHQEEGKKAFLEAIVQSLSGNFLLVVKV